MLDSNAYQLPAGIQMPARFTRSLSAQIWFFSGVQAGLEKRTPKDLNELKHNYGRGVADAYKAGLTAGLAKFEEVESSAHQISVPDKYSGSLQEKIWFLNGVDRALAGQPLEHPPNLPHRRSVELMQAFRAGYLIGERYVS